MVPVPDECLTELVIKNETDEKYRILLNKEYNFCMDNVARINKKANTIYNMVINNTKQKLTDNSCDFKILEEAYHKYIEESK